MKKIFLIYFAIILYSAPAHSQMAVTDVKTFAQMSELINKSMEQIKILQEQVSVLSEHYQTAQAMKNNIGEKVSLGISAMGWLNEDSADIKKCLIPAIGDFIPNLNLKETDLCSSQDFMRKELGIPTSRDVEKMISGNQDSLEEFGSYNWQSGFKTDSKGNITFNLPPKAIKEKRKKRQQFANDTRMSAVGLSTSVLSGKTAKTLDGLKSISNNLASKGSSTNELLLQMNTTLLAIYESVILSNTLKATHLQLNAGDSLENSSLILQ